MLEWIAAIASFAFCMAKERILLFKAYWASEMLPSLKNIWNFGGLLIRSSAAIVKVELSKIRFRIWLWALLSSVMASLTPEVTLHTDLLTTCSKIKPKLTIFLPNSRILLSLDWSTLVWFTLAKVNNFLHSISSLIRSWLCCLFWLFNPSIWLRTLRIRILLTICRAQAFGTKYQSRSISHGKATSTSKRDFYWEACSADMNFWISSW